MGAKHTRRRSEVFVYHLDWFQMLTQQLWFLPISRMLACCCCLLAKPGRSTGSTSSVTLTLWVTRVPGVGGRFLCTSPGENHTLYHSSNMSWACVQHGHVCGRSASAKFCSGAFSVNGKNGPCQLGPSAGPPFTVQVRLPRTEAVGATLRVIPKKGATIFTAATGLSVRVLRGS